MKVQHGDLLLSGMRLKLYRAATAQVFGKEKAGANLMTMDTHAVIDRRRVSSYMAQSLGIVCATGTTIMALGIVLTFLQLPKIEFCGLAGIGGGLLLNIVTMAKGLLKYVRDYFFAGLIIHNRNTVKSGLKVIA